MSHSFSRSSRTAGDFAGIAALATACLLAACEPPPQWTNAGVSSQQNQADLSYCNGAAELAKSYSMSSRGGSYLETTAAFESCMQKKGYRPEARKK